MVKNKSRFCCLGIKNLIKIGSRVKKIRVGQLVFRPLALLASGTSSYTRDAAVITANNSVECILNDTVQKPLFVAKNQRFCVARCASSRGIVLCFSFERQ